MSGISWYEAMAYAVFAGKSLPTIYHWDRVALTWASSEIVPFSNLSGTEVRPTGGTRARNRYGAFDLGGNQLWQVDVGRESSNRRWGTAASLILYKDFVIVNASEESQSIRALDKATGKELTRSTVVAPVSTEMNCRVPKRQC